ncbi:WD40 repeat domain-containing serine/threonine protein kinase [Candidatus Protofrankia californiensis]|uniref:WD40 repeat domain-containing serine/threonine protein kinase n=1 Tax=Candidatus Protofrankia californiensis TaxID=1839754 RepID=UPI001041374D|nr:serine/threonine-protein kinase [Candidatus Protofrankia californiensis]
MIINEARVAAALPGYELGTVLGQGAFGLVLAGRHRRLNRDVAIKILATEHDGAETSFAAEAQVLAALDHPHVVRIYDYVETDNLHLIVMELLGGGTLTRRRSGMSPRDACAVGLAAATALSYAHGRGVLHRDVKPDNMLFDAAGLLKVADFGIAKLVEGSAATASALKGTPMYMSPEQITGGRLGATTDLYALGVMLYHLLAGKPPFDPKLPLRVLWQHHLDRLPPPPEGVPTRVAEVVLHTLAKDPAARPPSAHAFALELAHAATTVYGPDWTARCGIRLRLDDDVRRVIEQPSTPGGHHPRPPAPPPEFLPPTRLAASQAKADASGDRSTGRDKSTGRGAGGGAGRGVWRIRRRTPPPDTPERAGRSRTPRRRRRRILAAVVVLLLGVTGTAFTIWYRYVTDTYISANAVAFSADGRTLATTGYDDGNYTVRLWDVSDRSAVRSLGQLTGELSYEDVLVFSPDGRTLATARSYGDDTVQLWDVSDPSVIRSLGQPLTTGHTGDVNALAFSPDSTILATASNDNTVRLWDLSDRSAVRSLGQPLTGHTGDVNALAFSPDGRTLATAGGSGDDTVRLWDLSNRSAVRSLGQQQAGRTSFVWSVAFSPDGSILAAGSGDGTVRLWDVSNRSATRPLGQPLTGIAGWVRPVMFSPDSRTLAAATDTGGVGRVWLWDVSDRSAVRSLGWPQAGYTDHVNALAFSPDGTTVAVGGTSDGDAAEGTTVINKSVFLWDLSGVR